MRKGSFTVGQFAGLLRVLLLKPSRLRALAAMVAVLSASMSFASSGGNTTVTWPAGLTPATFVTKLLTDNTDGIIVGSVIMVGLTVIMYIRKGFGKKAGQTAGR